MKNLKQRFCLEPELNLLVKGYPTQKTITQDDVIFCNSDLTFLILLEGFIPETKLKQSLFLHSDHQWQRTFTCVQKPMLLSKDYLDWLILRCHFQITVIHKVFFYKKCTVLNNIFKDLIELRLTENLSLSTKKLIKNIINYSVGFFGLNSNKHKPTRLKLVHNLGRRYNIIKNNTIFYKNVHFFIKHSIKQLEPQVKMSCTPIPIFVMIIEFGKLRMSKILCFFDQFLLPFQFKHLYSHVDNVILALATDTLEDAVDPKKLPLFLKESKNFFISNTPGHLKLEWIIFKEQEWKFATSHCMNYALLTNNQLKNVSKNSSLNNVSIQDSYDYALKLLNNQTVKVNQTRRVNKIINMDVKTTLFVYNNKQI
jgi:hypothetical protein